MLKFKTKWFNKWAKKSSLSDKSLLKTIENVSKNLGVIDLGSGLLKIRTPKVGQGKSGGFRTILVYREKDIAIFIYGFSKTEKDNLDKDELKYFKKLAKDLLKIDNKKIVELEEQGSFIKIKV
jgi:hypothetical protein